jgi:hypothetical protein
MRIGPEARVLSFQRSMGPVQTISSPRGSPLRDWIFEPEPHKARSPLAGLVLFNP